MTIQNSFSAHPCMGKLGDPLQVDSRIIYLYKFRSENASRLLICSVIWELILILYKYIQIASMSERIV